MAGKGTIPSNTHMPNKRWGASTAKLYHDLMGESDMELPPPGGDIMVPLDFGVVQHLSSGVHPRVIPPFMKGDTKRPPPPLEDVDVGTGLGLDLVVWTSCMYRDSDYETVYRLVMEGITPYMAKVHILDVYKRVTGSDGVIRNSKCDPVNFFFLEVGERDKRAINDYGEAHLGCRRGNHHRIPDVIYYRVEYGEGETTMAIFTQDQLGFYSKGKNICG